MAKQFDIDPRNKLGGEVDWETGNDFESFVDALNRGVAVRSDGLSGVSDLPRENQLDEIALGQLKSLFLNYR